MANNNFVVNQAQFTPLSFDEYYKPLALLNEQHQKLDDAYLELYTKASTIEQMANEQTDPEAYKQYKAYADDLRAAIETLDRNGLNPNSRREMLRMARRYGDEVAPIQGAYTRRAADITAQKEALSKDQSVRFSRKASESSLMDYMNNPSLSYESMSGAQITADVANKVKNLKNQLLSGTGEWKKTLGGQQYERILRYGLTPEIMADIVQNPDKYPLFKELIDTAVSASGVTSWGSKDDIAYAYNQALSGLWEGIGTDKPETVENKDLDRALKAQQIANARMTYQINAKKLAALNSQQQDTGGIHYRPEGTVVSAKERERMRTRKDDMEFMDKITSSNKELTAKQQERVASIARAYHIKPDEKTGKYDYNQIKNTIAAIDSERYRPLYTSNLTDESRLLESVGREMKARFTGGEMTPAEMQRLFPTTAKNGWKNVKLGKKNGVERTLMDVMNDIIHHEGTKLMVDPASGQLVLMQSVESGLGDIILYDYDKHGGKSPVFHNSNIGGLTFEQIMGELYDKTSEDYLYGDDKDYNAYTQGLIEMLFRYFTAVNNTVTQIPGNTDSDALVTAGLPTDDDYFDDYGDY